MLLCNSVRFKGVRIFLVFLASGLLASGQSHPSWWTFVAPDSKTLVGIEWQNLRTSPLGDAVEAELSGGGSLGIPELPCLKNSRDFLISAPPFLAAASGGCAAANLKTDAPALGMTKSLYRGIEIWSPQAGMSIAQYADRVVVIGARKNLEAAIDRSQAETKTYSPLLMSGAKLAHARDLWVVATTLPEPLAAIFVPLDVSAHNFEGGLSVKDGLDLAATFDAGTEAAANATVVNLHKSIEKAPEIVHGLQIKNEAASVSLALQVGNAQLQASLKPPTPAPAPLVIPSLEEAIPHVALPEPVEHIIGHFDPPAPAFATRPPEPESKPEPKPESKPEPARPAAPRLSVGPAPERRVVRIYGLDEGVREIVLPSRPPDQP
jgi:hypothetical protein